ncbi:Carcinine transporter [Portunus trituberculatus]|uniref:Carcinine transporter n=1 Tax=Portunus trituberculatus TaxID=210409 RepID=A0A5B7H338_PORTR|nr:Carcinine transporter [Portunus trituberculatus]
MVTSTFDDIFQHIGGFGRYQMSKYDFTVPFVTLGLVSIAGSITSVLLPETLDQDLPDTLVDGETFFVGQNYCYKLWSKYVVRKERRREDMC